MGLEASLQEEGVLLEVYSFQTKRGRSATHLTLNKERALDIAKRHDLHVVRHKLRVEEIDVLDPWDADATASDELPPDMET